MLLFKNLVILNQNDTIYTMFSQFLYLSKEMHKQASELPFSLEWWWMHAKSKNHDSGSHFKKSAFKNGYWEKKYPCNWFEVASKIEHSVST